MTKEEVLIHLKKVFRYDATDRYEDFITPPKQVLSNDKHSIILVGGGNIVDQKSGEYDELMKVLQTIGETEYYLLLPIYPFMPSNFEYVSISTKSTVKEMNSALEYFFGMDFPMDDLYMFGSSGKWGIYIDDGIMMNIISCEPQYAPLFVNAQKIKPTEFEENIKLVRQGYELRAIYDKDGSTNANVLFNQFVENYVNSTRNYFSK